MNTSTTCARCDELVTSHKLDVPTTAVCASCGKTITESVAEDALCTTCRYHDLPPQPPKPTFDLIDVTVPAPTPQLPLEHRILQRIEDADTLDDQLAALEIGIDEARYAGIAEGLKLAIDLTAGTSIGAALRRIATGETLQKCAADVGLSCTAIFKAETKIRQNKSRLKSTLTV